MHLRLESTEGERKKKGEREVNLYKCLPLSAQMFKLNEDFGYISTRTEWESWAALVRSSAQGQGNIKWREKETKRKKLKGGKEKETKKETCYHENKWTTAPSCFLTPAPTSTINHHPIIHI